MISKYTHNWLIRDKNRQVVSEILPYFVGELLDVGCGNKPYESIIQPQVEKYVGLEHPKSLHLGNKIDIYGDACQLPLGNETFDTVVAFQVMEHLLEPDMFLSEAFRVLRPKGVLVLTTPFMWGIHEAPYDFYRFTIHGLRYLLKKNHFKIIQISPIFGYWVMTGLRFNYYLKNFEKDILHLLFILIYNFIQLTCNVLDKIHFCETDVTSYLSLVSIYRWAHF